MKRGTHGGEEGHLLFLIVLGNVELFLTQIRNVVSFSGRRYDRNSDEVGVYLKGVMFLCLFNR